MLRLVSLFGIGVLVSLAWLLSRQKRAIRWRLVIAGILLQWVLAAVVFGSQTWTFGGRYPEGILFAGIAGFFELVNQWVRAGAEFVFGLRPDVSRSGDALMLLSSFAFGVMPTVIFFASLMSVLYHVGLMQRIVGLIAWCMQRTLGVSGAESFAVAANIFVGHTEAPLVVRPYLATFTRSELCTVMVSGFATISGGLLAAFAALGIHPGHLVTASIISAPAALVIAKILEPETERPVTADASGVKCPRTSVNVIDAAAQGAADGLRLALNIVAMLIAFLALIAMCDTLLAALGHLTSWLVNQLPGSGSAVAWHWSLKGLLGIVFWPLVWLAGVPVGECREAARLLGEKTVLNEFVAYVSLSRLLAEQAHLPAEAALLSPRTVVILTYALCGFSNFGAIGIQIGGIGALVPERRSELAELGLRAMIGGSLACLMTACVAGTLL
ncbi:MAG: nucleoside transporter NupC [Pirellulaceae bacterium]|nr:MAG: nucleoside transporter NupC [Pirellulaceae bacterium]GIW93817.1 MAG: nucleoside transporter NupC [Pirellulaceae bacterium]